MIHSYTQLTFQVGGASFAGQSQPHLPRLTGHREHDWPHWLYEEQDELRERERENNNNLALHVHALQCKIYTKLCAKNDFLKDRELEVEKGEGGQILELEKQTPMSGS